MLRKIAPALLLALIPALPRVAAAGWTARQVSTGSGPPQSATLTFDDGYFRIDPDKAPSVIVDVAHERLTFINHDTKRYATKTIAELKALRDQQIAQVKQELPGMPPEVRQQVEARIKAVEAGGAKDLGLKPLDKSEKVNGYTCKLYTWSAADGGGEACIASSIGADDAAFRKATTKLADKLAALSGGQAGPSSFAMLELGKHGFPVRTKQSIEISGQKIEIVSEMRDIKAEKIDPSRFQPPKEYKPDTLQAVMDPQGKAAVQPGVPPEGGHPHP